MILKKQMEFTFGKIFIGASICYENHKLFYRSRQLKGRVLQHSVCFFNNCITIKVGENSEVIKIKHASDIEKALIMENIFYYLGIIA